MGRNDNFIFYHPDDPEYDGGPVAPGDKYVFVHDDDKFYDDYVLNDDDDSLPDYYVVTDDDILVYDNGAVHVHNDNEFDHGAAHHNNNNGAPDHLFNLFYDEFNKHYDHLNDDAPTAAAIDYVNNHDYDEPSVPSKCHCGRYNPCRHHDHYDIYDYPDDDFIQYVNDYYSTDDDHLVNKHHNYD
jgi:hypothetical protein